MALNLERKVQVVGTVGSAPPPGSVPFLKTAVEDDQGPAYPVGKCPDTELVAANVDA